MALGPKAMGEAIIANLKSKSGKTLQEWQQLVTKNGLTTLKEAQTFLKSQGLGHIQAYTVAETMFGKNEYSDPAKLVADLFADFPELKPLYKQLTSELTGKGMQESPCRTYLPFYQDGKIAVSLLPTVKGLYAALNLNNPGAWEEVHSHTIKLGGSSRLKHGVYITESSQIAKLLENF